MDTSLSTLAEWAGVPMPQVALVFTDIVESTALLNKLGDKRWIEVLIEHLRQARGILKKFDCCEIKFIGDSFMVAFRTPVDALQFALLLHANTGHPKVKLRAGIHAGAVRILENDLFGGMVNYTSRVLAKAEDDSIVISDFAKAQIVQELGGDSRELLFSEMKTTLKGFDDPYKHKLWLVETSRMRRAATARHRRSMERMGRELSTFISEMNALLETVSTKRKMLE